MHTILAADGTRLSLTLQGGQVCSWIDPEGLDHLYMSPAADFSGQTAIRGGIPVIFPQFGAHGPLLRHGFARLQRWRLLGSGIDHEGHGVARLGLHHTADALFGHDCGLELELRFHACRLETTLVVRNHGDQPFRFTAALHTYLRAPVERAQVRGLQGRRYQDAALGGQAGQGTPGALAFDREIDRIYFDVTDPLELHGGARPLSISQRGFPDVVVWNPGEAAGSRIGDLPAGGWRQFVCVEAALVGTPLELAPGARWAGSQVLQAVAPA